MDALIEQIHHHAANKGDAIAVYDERASLTYRMFDVATDLIAYQIRDAGFGPGNVVAYLGGIGTGRTASYVGALKAGTAFMMLDERNPPAVNRDLLQHAGASAVLVETERYEALAAGLMKTAGLTETLLRLPPLTEPSLLDRSTVAPFPFCGLPGDTVAHIRYTSGSSGRLKGIPVTRHSEESYIKLLTDLWKVTADDKVAVFGPFWPPQVGGALYAGGTIAAYDFAVRGPGDV